MQELKEQWTIDSNVKRKYIDSLVPELKVLRAKAGISQDDLAKAISISRQTYCQIENGNKDMSWSVYLSLIFFFDSIEETSKLLTLLDVYPERFVNQIQITAKQKAMEF